MLVEIQNCLNTNKSRISYGNKIPTNTVEAYLLEMTYREKDRYIAVGRLSGVLDSKRPSQSLRDSHNNFEIDMEKIFTEIERMLLTSSNSKINIKNTVVKL